MTPTHPSSPPASGGHSGTGTNAPYYCCSGVHHAGTIGECVPLLGMLAAAGCFGEPELRSSSRS